MEYIIALVVIVVVVILFSVLGGSGSKKKEQENYKRYLSKFDPEKNTKKLPAEEVEVVGTKYKNDDTKISMHLRLKKPQNMPRITNYFHSQTFFGRKPFL